MKRRIQRIQRKKVVTVIIVLTVLIFAFQVLQARPAAPLTLTGPNLVANNDFSVDADHNGIPDGWTPAFPDGKGIQIGSFTVRPNSGHSVFIAGANNWLRSPLIAVRPGTSYRTSLMALADDTAKQSDTRLEIWYYWRDARGTDFDVEYSAAQTVPYGTWSQVTASFAAPPRATQLSVAIHPLTDDRIVVDQFSLAEVGVHIGDWPQGKRAAVAFSFDYETAMAGLIHSRSEDDPNTGVDPLLRAGRMRAGADVILQLFGKNGIRGTFYTTGYNFLSGNTDHRVWMNNPTYPWATVQNRWSTDYWATHPWFSKDPYSDENSPGGPEWYFGSQVVRLLAAGQSIESHTFAHFSGSYVGPADWQADFAAWKQVAQALGVGAASSLAFPWSSSAGMSAASWQVLVDQGIRSVTRTNVTQPRFALADRATYALRPLAFDPRVTMIADEYIQPARINQLSQRLNTAIANGGAIDLWAHTEEIVTPAQGAAWQALIDQARPQCWIAPVGDIVAFHAAVQQVRIKLESEQPQLRFTVTNSAASQLAGLTLTLPIVPQRMTIDGKAVPTENTQLIFDLGAHQTAEVVVWPAQ